MNRYFKFALGVACLIAILSAVACRATSATSFDEQAWAAYFQQDDATARQAFAEAADGDARAAYMLSVLAEHRDDAEEADRWLDKAAALGSSAAAYMQVVKLYEAHDESLPPGARAQAMETLKGVADRGFTPTDLALGMLLATADEASESDLVEAFGHLERAHKAGNRLATMLLGLINLIETDDMGIDITRVKEFKQDPARGVAYLEEALSDDFMLPAFFLASIYQDGAPGIAPDEEKADYYGDMLGANIFGLVSSFDLAELQQVRPEDLLSAEEKKSIVAALKRQAEKSDGNAAVALARLHAEGTLVAADEAQAESYYRQAAKLDHPEALMHLAEDAENQDKLDYLERAAAQDHIPALKALASIYQNPFWSNVDHLEPDEARAADYIRQAADLDDPGAMLDLAARYEAGDGVEASQDEAHAWLKKALVEQPDDADIYMRIGHLYDTHAADSKQAFEAFNTAYELEGDDDAALQLARYYAAGRAVPQDVPKALELYEQIIADEDAHYWRDAAMLAAAQIYREGADGVDPDFARAHELLTELVDDDDEDAALLLAEDYLEGRGVAQDEAKARALLRELADNDNTQAEVRLALIELPHLSGQERQKRQRELLDAAHYLDDDAPVREKIYALLDPSNDADMRWLSEEADDDPRAGDKLAAWAETKNHPAARYVHGLRLLEARDPATRTAGFAHIQAAAETGSHGAMRALSRLYFGEDDIPGFDADAGLAWLQRAARSPEHEDDDFLQLGDIYYRGDHGIAADTQEALSWYQKVSAEERDSNDTLQERIADLEEAIRKVKTARQAYRDGDLDAGYELADWYHYGHYGLDDPDAWFALLQELAAKGHAEAQWDLAHSADAAERLDESERAHYALLAAENGRSDAMANIANRYLHGTGVAVDRSKARHWFEQARRRSDLREMDEFDAALEKAEDDMDAAAQAGAAYRSGTGTAVDFAGAERHLRRAAKADRPEALVQLADMLIHGETGEVDWDQAADLLKRAGDHGDAAEQLAFYQTTVVPAQQGDVEAMTRLAETMLDDYESNGERPRAQFDHAWALLDEAVAADNGRAAWLKAQAYSSDEMPAHEAPDAAEQHRSFVEKAAELGEPNAQLALVYILGSEDAISDADWERMESLLKASADQGLEQAFSALVGFYEYGGKGHDAQPEKLVAYLNASCDDGKAQACIALAKAKRYGRYGLSTNTAEAAALMERKALADNIDAQLELGALYLEGDGKLEPDWNKASDAFLRAHDVMWNEALTDFRESIENDSSFIRMPDLRDEPASAGQIAGRFVDAGNSLPAADADEGKTAKGAIAIAWLDRALDEEGNTKHLKGAARWLAQAGDYEKAWYYANASGYAIDRDLREAVASKLSAKRRAAIEAEAEAAHESADARVYVPFITALREQAEEVDDDGTLWYQLAHIYMDRQYAHEDLHQAAQYLAKSGAAGMTGSYRLAANLMREAGDHEAAVDYYAQGAEAGDMVAAHLAGNILATGMGGVTVDNLRAIHYYEMADPVADERHAEARFHEAEIYYHMQPDGPEASLKKARELLELAAKYGESRAADALESWDFSGGEPEPETESEPLPSMKDMNDTADAADADAPDRDTDGDDIVPPPPPPPPVPPEIIEIDDVDDVSEDAPEISVMDIEEAVEIAPSAPAD